MLTASLISVASIKFSATTVPSVTLVARILSESITLITQDPGLQITTVLYLLECPAPYFLGPLLLFFIGKACGALPENENERFLHLAPCNSVPMTPLA